MALCFEILFQERQQLPGTTWGGGLSAVALPLPSCCCCDEVVHQQVVPTRGQGGTCALMSWLGMQHTKIHLIVWSWVGFLDLKLRASEAE